MTRRSRIRLLIVLVVLGIPLALCVGLLWFVGAGGLERRLEREWRTRFPGTLDVGRVEIAGSDRVVIHDLVVVGDDGGEAIVRIGRVDIAGGVMPLRIAKVAASGVHLRFDRDGLVFLRDLVARLPAGDGRAAPPFRLELDGEAVVAGRLRLETLALRADIAGREVRGGIETALAGPDTPAGGGRPLRLEVRPEPGALAARVVAARIDLGELLRTLHALGVMAPPDDLVPWLPGDVDATGAEVRFDFASRVLTGRAAPTWAGGRGEADLRIDTEGLHLTALRATDAALGSGEGRLDVDFATRALTVGLARWAPGSRLPVPAAVPLPALLELMPAARLQLSPDGPRIVFTALTALEGAPTDAPRVELRWRRRAPLAVEAGHLPFTLARAFLPAKVAPTAGTVDRLAIAVEGGQLQRLTAHALGLGLAVDAWRVAGVDAEVDITAVDPHDPAAGFTTRVDLPTAGIIHRGRLSDGQLTVTIARLGELARLVRGPTPLPRLGGLLKLECDVRRDEAGAWSGRIRHLGLGAADAEGILRDGALAARDGRFTWRGRTVEARLDGQLQAGEVRLPNGRWLDLAARTPRVAATVRFAPGEIRVSELLARAADRFGQPAAQGFTAGLSAELDHDLSGRISGVVDRADLGWFRRNDLVLPLPADAVATGEGAITFAATVADGALVAVDGHVLPLDVDLTLLDGKLDISGIQGALRFRITPPPK